MIKQKQQLEAVRKNPYYIEYIKNPDIEVQLEAVNKNGYAIKYIKNPLAAVSNYRDAIEYIKNPHKSVLLYLKIKNML